MALFSGKPAKNDIPVNQVVSMKSQGIDNNRIIQTLQRDGYTSGQIFEAMNQADRTPTTKDVNTQDEMLSDDFGGDTPNFDPSQEDNQRANQQPIQNLQPPPNQQFNNNLTKTDIEELVESIIEEKWESIVKDIKRIVEWKNDSEVRIKSMNEKMDSLKEEFDKLQQAVLGKVGEYDKNIMMVGAEIKAMEKVFSKVLPVFTENVSELSRITDKIKKKGSN